MGLFDGIGQALGGIAGAVLSPFETNAQNQVTQGEIQGQENYETQMSDTAYQRQVADMKAAGINPILSAQTGGGASTPSAAAPGGAAMNPNVSMPDWMGYGVSLKKLEQQDRALDLQADKQVHDNAETDARSGSDTASASLANVQAKLARMGLLGRELGTDATDNVKSIIQRVRDSVLVPPQPTNMGQPSPQPSSGGSIPPEGTSGGPMGLPL